MTVKELIEILSEFDPDLPVSITDGFECKVYEGKFDIGIFDDTVDIGIGGLEVRE
jgi:hypothetical protein